MPVSTKYDVIVIGAGVAGCYAAGDLAKLGYSVAVLDKNHAAGSKRSCTGIISRECLDLLPAGRDAIQFEARSAKVFAPSGKYIRIARDDTQAYVLDRPALDRTLAASAAGRGANFIFSALVTSLRIHDDIAIVDITRDAEKQSLKANVIILACGAGTSLTRQAGLGRISEFAQGAQCLVRTTGLEEVEVHTGTDVAPGFFAWLVPSGRSQAKAGLLSRENPAPLMAAFLSRFERSGRIKPGKHAVEFGIIPLKPLSRTYGERLLVAGDAAGQVKPTTGGGIYFGALCARLAANAVHKAFSSGDLSAKSLSKYQRDWHKLLKQELYIDYWAHRFYQGLSNRQMEHIFDIMERHGIHESILASPDITFDWHGKVILDAFKYRSLQRSLEKLGMGVPPQSAKR
jgi:geranylgeranyl reductase family protein